MTRNEFISTFSLPAQRQQQKHGILSSITLAQAALETGWAKFIPADKYTGKQSYNLFGIKGKGPAGSVRCDTWEHINGKNITVEAEFAAYNSWDESIEEHGKLLLIWRYRKVRAATGYAEAARELQAAGYATDPDYAQKLIAIIRENDLDQFDSLPAVPFPDVPIGHWAVDMLAELKEAGVIKGMPDGQFYGYSGVSRYEFAAGLWAVIKYLKK